MPVVSLQASVASHWASFVHSTQPSPSQYGVGAAQATQPTPRYNEAAAKLSWERTVAFFKRNLA